MTISSSLNAGVAGLNANASKLAAISDNIANSSTYGYKRAATDFESMVVGSNPGGAGTYSAGGVHAINYRVIDERGALVGTSNALDLAAAGRGMLPVTTSAALKATDGELPLMMTTTGGFRPDENGILRTQSGLVLLGWPANADGTVPTYPRDTVAGLQPVAINANQTSADPTTKVTLGVNLPAKDTDAGATGDTLPLSVEYFDNLGASRKLDISFTPSVPAVGSSNTWRMTVHDSAAGGAVIGEYDVTFDGTRTNGGAIQSVTTISGGAYDATTGSIPLTVAGGALDMMIGSPGDSAGLTQLSKDFSPTGVTKNGSPVGNLTGVEVDKNGFMKASYDTGFVKTIYQIPLVDVANVNGLTALDNQTFQVSKDSGSFFLWDAGSGPTGDILGFSREGSTTDVAAELTSLIQTQRAYSSNAKVIQTVDEMLQETTNIKR